MPTKILIADDHIAIYVGLKKWFKTDFGYQDIETVTTCNGVLKALKKSRHSHLILDIGLADGSALEIIPTIRSLYPETRITVYSMRPRQVYIHQLQKLDVYSYLDKEAGEQETLRHFRAFLGNLDVQENCESVETKNETSLKVKNPLLKLTKRHFDLLPYLIKGESGAGIAKILNVKPTTVSMLKAQIFERTGVKNRFELRSLVLPYKASTIPMENPLSLLTERQLEVLRHLREGKSGSKIADLLNISGSAVSMLKAQIFERTGVKTTDELNDLFGGQKSSAISMSNPFSSLTGRHLIILHHFLKGKSCTDIANLLNIRLSTVSAFKGQILERTGANTMDELFDLAYAFNI